MSLYTAKLITEVINSFIVEEFEKFKSAAAAVTVATRFVAAAEAFAKD